MDSSRTNTQKASSLIGQATRKSASSLVGQVIKTKAARTSPAIISTLAGSSKEESEPTVEKNSSSEESPRFLQALEDSLVSSITPYLVMESPGDSEAITNLVMVREAIDRRGPVLNPV